MRLECKNIHKGSTKSQYAVEEGDIVNDRLCGLSKRTFEDGTIEVGEFVNGYLHGSGKRTYDGHDGSSKEEGEYDDGYLISGEKIYGGIKEEDEYVGGDLVKGTVTFDDGQEQDGNFANGRLNGPGKLTLADGQVQQGNFEDGKLVEGTVRDCKLNDGSTYTGQIVCGRPNGSGKRIYVDGEVHDSNFVNGKLAKGTVTFPDKEAEEGGRVNGHLHGEGKRQADHSWRLWRKASMMTVA